MPGNARGGTRLYKKAAQRAGSVRDAMADGARFACRELVTREGDNCSGKITTEPQARYFRASRLRSRVALELSDLARACADFNYFLPGID